MPFTNRRKARSQNLPGDTASHVRRAANFGSNREGALEDADCGAADTRNQLFAGLRYFHFNVTRPAHLVSLKKAERVTGRELAVANKVGSEGAGSRTGGGVFVDFPRQHAAGKAFAISTESKAIGHGGSFAEELAEVEHVHGDFAERGAIAERNHEIENAGRDVFRIEMRIEIGEGKAQRLGERGFFEPNGPE